MLAQAVVAARVGRDMKKDNTKPFVLMALYLTKGLIVERYLVSQPDDDEKKTV